MDSPIAAPEDQRPRSSENAPQRTLADSNYIEGDQLTMALENPLPRVVASERMPSASVAFSYALRVCGKSCFAYVYWVDICVTN